MSHQSRAAANDPQVPGPGWSRPTPKNVATSVAQRGAGWAVANGATSVWLLEPLIGIAGVVRLRIIQRSRDDVPATGPLAKIDEAAAIAAEREVRLARKHNLTAGGTTR